MRALLRMLPAGKRAEVHMYRSFDPNLPKPKPGREDTPAFIQSAQGRSSLATDADITYTVLGHIMDQLDGMIDKGIKASTMPASELKRMYFHLGGDELFLSGCAREFLVVDDVFRSCSDSTKTFVPLVDMTNSSYTG